MTTRLVIGVDLDDVLADFISEFTRFANARFGRPALGTQPVDWEWSNFGLSKDEQDAVWADIKSEPYFWETLDAEKGADPSKLHALDILHTVYFPTARVNVNGPDPAARQSARWLRNGFGIRFPQVFAAFDKKPMALALKYDYFIDDRPKNCIDIQDALPQCKVYLKDSSHNQTFVCGGPNNNFTRVKDFNEFADIILEGK